MATERSKSTDKLAIMAEVAKAAAPHIGHFSKVTVKLTWSYVDECVVPIAEVVMER